MDFEHFGTGSLERNIHSSWKNYSIKIVDLDGILTEARQSEDPVAVFENGQISEVIEYALIDCKMIDNEALMDEEFETGCDLHLTAAYLSDNPLYEQTFDSFIRESETELEDLDISPIREPLYLVQDRKFGASFIINLMGGSIHITNRYLDDGPKNEFLIEPMPKSILPPEVALVSLARTTAAVINFLERSGKSRGQLGQEKPIMGAKEMILKIQAPSVPLPQEVPELNIKSGTEINRLQDIAGLEEIKEELSNIVLSFTHPEIFQLWSAERPRGLFFHGPAGTGKSMTARVLANMIDAEFTLVQSSKIQNKWLGGSEKRIKKIFDEACGHKGRLVLFFDEFESIIHNISESTDSGSAVNNAIAGIFKEEMERLFAANPNVLVIAASNHPDLIDKELLRSGRFDTKLYFKLPDISSRKEIFASYISRGLLRSQLEGPLILEDIERTDSSPDSIETFDYDIDTDQLAGLSDTLSGADIEAILRKVRFNKAIEHTKTGQIPSPISTNDIKREIERFKRRIIS